MIEQARAGDGRARASLVEAHLGALRAFMRLRLGQTLRHRETSLDLVQSVVREALEDLARFEYRGAGSFRQWLLRRAENKIRDRARFWTRERRSSNRETTVEAGADDESEARAVTDQLATFFTPSRHASAREELERVERAFLALPEDWRRVILLARVLGLSHEAIGREIGRTALATRTLLCRALARLTTLLDDGSGAGRDD